MYSMILVRYGEITLKSPKVRRRMERVLIDNIREQLRIAGVCDVNMTKEGGRIFVRTRELRKALLVLPKVFGVVSVSPVMECSRDLEELINAVVKYSRRVLAEGLTFAVRVHRADKSYPMTSVEVARILGKAILEAKPGVKVNLERPEVELSVEIRGDRAYIFHEIIKGPGGLPYGVEGKAVALISGGMDSAIAAWMIMKRGCEVIPVFCDLTPYFEGEGRRRAIDVLFWLRDWVPRKWKIYVAPLGLAHSMISGLEPKYRCLVCKSLMYLVAEAVAIKEGAKAIVTGESLGQVASQTLDNLLILSKLIKLPILRPLIGLDKNEIADLARRLGVYDVATAHRVACRLVPKHPVTHAEEAQVKSILTSIDLDHLVRWLYENSQIVVF